MKHARLALFLIMVAPVGLSAAPAQQLRAVDLLSIYRDLNDMCHNRSGDGVHTTQACNVREKVSRLLNTLGYCYGTQSAEAADLQWHKCAERELF
jgi:hypothetical protein